MAYRKISVPPGCLYIEPEAGTVLAVGNEPSIKCVYTVVRTGPPEVNEHGVTMPVLYQEGDKVVVMPQSALPTPRGAVCHQNRIAWKVVEAEDGPDEMAARDTGMLRLSQDAAKALLGAAARPIEA